MAKTARKKKKKDKRGGRRPGSGRKPLLPDIAPIIERMEVAKTARSYAHLALQAYVEICTDRNQPGAARVAAANAIMDRGYGKPPQSIEHSNKDGNPLEINARFSEFAKLLDDIAQQRLAGVKIIDAQPLVNKIAEDVMVKSETIIEEDDD